MLMLVLFLLLVLVLLSLLTSGDLRMQLQWMQRWRRNAILGLLRIRGKVESINLDTAGEERRNSISNCPTLPVNTIGQGAN